jgi:RNA polymerase sigma-70 factor (ECF subfamily)
MYNHRVTTPAPFPKETVWSLVLGATDRSSPEWKARLESLIGRYWKPVWWYLVRRWNCSPDDAADLAQEFFARLYEEDFLRQASPDRGRFRTFLKLKLRDLVVQDLRRRGAEKRGGRAKILSIDRTSDEGVLELEWPGLSPDEQFDRVWAACLLSGAIQELREKLRAEGREPVFKAFWSCAATNPPQSYKECAHELGVKVSDVGNYVFRARGELRRILLRLVHDSVEREGDRQEELDFILSLLGDRA